MKDHETTAKSDVFADKWDEYVRLKDHIQQSRDDWALVQQEFANQLHAAVLRIGEEIRENDSRVDQFIQWAYWNDSDVKIDWLAEVFGITKHEVKLRAGPCPDKCLCTKCKKMKPFQGREVRKYYQNRIRANPAGSWNISKGFMCAECCSKLTWYYRKDML